MILYDFKALKTQFSFTPRFNRQMLIAFLTEFLSINLPSLQWAVKTIKFYYVTLPLGCCHSKIDPVRALFGDTFYVKMSNDAFSVLNMTYHFIKYQTLIESLDKAVV